MDTAQPRSISTQERVWHVVLATCLLTYGGIGLYLGDLFIPGKHSRGIHLHGTAAWIMFAAFICASLNLLSIFADHFDSSDGERLYHILARATQIAGWALFIGALAFSLVHSGTHQW